MFEKKQEQVIEKLRAELRKEQERVIQLINKCMQQSDKISALITENEELAKYKEMYADELQKRLEFAAIVRELETEVSNA